jgi:hypothetical protein
MFRRHALPPSTKSKWGIAITYWYLSQSNVSFLLGRWAIERKNQIGLQTVSPLKSAIFWICKSRLVRHESTDVSEKCIAYNQNWRVGQAKKGMGFYRCENLRSNSAYPTLMLRYVCLPACPHLLSSIFLINLERLPIRRTVSIIRCLTWLSRGTVLTGWAGLMLSSDGLLFYL